MKQRPANGLIWLFCALIVASALALTIRSAIIPTPDNPSPALRLIVALVSNARPILLAVLAALILTRQHRNPIGWLMLILAANMAAPVTDFSAILVPPPAPSFGFYLALWFNNWNWVLTIFPVLLIALYFPTGVLPAPRWRWVIVLVGLMVAVMLVLATFSRELSPTLDDWNAKPWAVHNPIGFLPNVPGWFLVLWDIGLVTATILCVASIFARYRHAGYTERQQIKWLLYAFTIFALAYLPMVATEGALFSGPIGAFLFAVAGLTIPLALGIAILRYRVFDIDIIIRRTLQYAIITVLLAAIYIGSVILLQLVLLQLTGQQSQFAVALSTLALAALFSPLRLRVQRWVDRRFYRSRYNAEQIVATFARTAQHETDLDQITSELVGIIRTTIHPTTAVLWLADSPAARAVHTADAPAALHIQPQA